MWQFFQAVVPASVLIAAVAWLAKTVTTHQLGLDVERFKEDLQRSVDAFKSELAIDAHRRNTIFTRLHERRVDCIAELYAALTAAELAVHHYVTPMGAPALTPGGTHMQNAVDAMWTLMRTAEARRIWFRPETSKRIDEVVGELRSAYNLMAVGQHAANQQPSETTYKMWFDAWTKVSEKVPALRGTLETDFRTLLGVELGQTATTAAPKP